MNDAGELLMDEYAKLLNPRTKMVAVVHLSNSLGTINDVKEIVRQAHAVGAKVLIDGAQWVAHYQTDVQAIGCDFYAFSGHKLLGPTGIGVLWGKRALLDAMPPYQGGGDMIEQVTFERTTYAQLPNKFEAGTPNIAGGIGLGAAVRWLAQIGLANCAAHEHDLLDYATERLSEVPGLRIVGTARQKGSVVSFVIENPPMASLDIGAQLDQLGIAVRTGHHCCQPVMDRLGIASTSRASFALYNTRADVDALADALVKIRGESLARHAAHKVVAAAEGAELKYPVVSAGNPQAAADELVDVFEFLGDWNERYQYLIEMGEKLLPMPANEKNETNRVHGCQSTVHLSGRKQPGSGDRLDFLADSDADLVRGLIAILQKIYSGQRAGDILAFDIDAFFGRLGLDQHLTQGRRNGLAGMVQRIRALASIISGTKGQS
jgi:cysteine desulfurase/selenocysteine lyase